MRQYAWKGISTDDFQKLADTASKQDLTYFFAQWVTSTGVPQLSSVTGTKVFAEVPAARLAALASCEHALTVATAARTTTAASARRAISGRGADGMDMVTPEVRRGVAGRALGPVHGVGV